MLWSDGIIENVQYVLSTSAKQVDMAINCNQRKARK